MTENEERKLHTVTVSGKEDDSFPTWVSTCDGTCNLWVECSICMKAGTELTDAEREQDEDEEGFDRHGVYHFLREGFVGVELSGCALDHFDSAQDSVGFALREADTAVGETVSIDLDYEGDGDFYVRIIPAADPEGVSS